MRTELSAAMVQSLSSKCTPDCRNTTSTARGKKPSEPLMVALLVVPVWASEVEKLMRCWSHTPSTINFSVRAQRPAAPAGRWSRWPGPECRACRAASRSGSRSRCSPCAPGRSAGCRGGRPAGKSTFRRCGTSRRCGCRRPPAARAQTATAPDWAASDSAVKSIWYTGSARWRLRR